MKKCVAASLITIACLGLFGVELANAIPVFTSVSFDGHYTSVRNGFGTGPYGLNIPANSGQESLWFCFNAGQEISQGIKWDALLMSSVEAANYLPSDLIRDIAYLANKVPEAEGSPSKLADINEAMWMITGMLLPDNHKYQYISQSGEVMRLAAEALTLSSDARTLPATFLIPITKSDCTSTDASGYCYNYSDGRQPFVQPVPEPATLLLLGSGLVGLASMARRRNRRK